MSLVSRIESLPFLASECILQSMGIEELLLMARTSPTLQALIPFLKLRSGGFRVHLGFWSRVEIPNYHFTYSRNNYPRPCIEDIDDFLFGCQRLLTGDVEYLNVCPSLVWEDISGSTNVLAIGQSEEEYGCWERDRIEDVPEADLNYLLDNIRFKKGLALNGPKELKSEHEKVFAIDWLRLSHTDWVTLDILNKMRNKIIYLKWVSLTPQNVNEYLLDLVAGIGNSNLQLITFHQRWNEIEMQEILNGLELVPNQQLQTFEFTEEESKMEMSEFLPTSNYSKVSAKGVEIPESLDMICEDGVRRSLVFGQDVMTGIPTMSVFVWTSEGRKRGADEVAEGPSAKRARLNRVEF